MVEIQERRAGRVHRNHQEIKECNTLCSGYMVSRLIRWYGVCYSHGEQQAQCSDDDGDERLLLMGMDPYDRYGRSTCAWLVIVL